LASVCQDPSSDVVVLAFLTTFFGTDGLPVINFASSCNAPNFPGTDLLECDQIGYVVLYLVILTLTYRQDIATCQDAGKIVLLSLGGAVGDYGFSSSSEAKNFATTLWNLFGEGTSSTRPFGSSIVDGFDLGSVPDYCTNFPDIENNQPQYYSNFISASRNLFATGSKQYYITGAPQYTPCIN
jgi:chitinase